MPYDLNNPNTVVFYAALLESEQAYRDEHTAYLAWKADGFSYGSPQDYAISHTIAYTEAAERAVQDMPVWDVSA